MSWGKFLPESSMSVGCRCCGKEFPIEFEKQTEWIQIQQTVGGGPVVYFCGDCGQVIGMVALRLVPANIEQFKKLSLANKAENAENK